MKKSFRILALTLLTIFVWSQSNSQEKTIEVTYVKAFKHHRDTTKTLPKVYRNLEYKLLCNNNESHFEYVQRMDVDDKQSNKRFISRGGGDGVYYSSLKENTKINQNQIDEENICLITGNFNNYKWKLINETKKILNYNCFKATAEFEFYNPIKKNTQIFKVSVWYAPSIPIPFGPSGYDGLPGLVLESWTGSMYFIAKDIKFHKNELKIKRPIKGKVVTIEEFRNLIYESFLQSNKD